MASKLPSPGATGAAAFAPLAFATIVTPGVSSAVECGLREGVRRAVQQLRRRARAPATSAASTSAKRGFHAVVRGRGLRTHSGTVWAVDMWRHPTVASRTSNFAKGLARLRCVWHHGR